MSKAKAWKLFSAHIRASPPAPALLNSPVLILYCVWSHQFNLQRKCGNKTGDLYACSSYEEETSWVTHRRSSPAPICCSGYLQPVLQLLGCIFFHSSANQTWPYIASEMRLDRRIQSSKAVNSKPWFPDLQNGANHTRYFLDGWEVE